MKPYPDDWPFRLTIGVTTAACIVATFLLEPMVGVHGFWSHIITVMIAVIVANRLGRVVYRLLFQQSPRDLPKPPPRA